MKPDSEVIVTYSSKSRVDISMLVDNWDTHQVGDLVSALRRYGLNVSMVRKGTKEKNDNHLVSGILIDDMPFTGKECFVSKEAHINIEYYSQIIKIGQSSKEFEDKQYSEVVTLLKEKGFTNIELRRTDDLITGWWNHEGSIKSIHINGNSKFGENDEFYCDDKIVIVVYTFRNEGCEDITVVDGD